MSALFRPARLVALLLALASPAVAQVQPVTGVAADPSFRLVNRDPAFVLGLTNQVIASETSELVAKALVARGVATVFVANRHYDRAIGLAQRFDGTAATCEDFVQCMEQAGGIDFWKTEPVK